MNPYERADKWKEKDDLALFLQFSSVKGEDIGAKKAGDRRVGKYCDTFVGIRTMTGKSVSHAIKDLTTLKEAVLRIEDRKNLLPRNKRPKVSKNKDIFSLLYAKDCRDLLGRLYTFKHLGKTSFNYAPMEVKELLERRAKPSERKLSKAVLTRDEVRTMLDYADTLDKAIIMTLFDSGARIGEFEYIKVKDLRNVKEGLEITINQGKTGARRVLVKECISYLGAWLNEHPIRGKDNKVNPEAYLWTSFETRRRISQGGLTKRIERVAKKVKGLDKSVNPHNFRHSRASELGGMPGMTEPILCTYFGWVLGSDMVRTYLHLSDEQIRRAVASTFGEGKIEAHKIETERTCMHCKTKQPISTKYCGQCGSDMDTGVVYSSIEDLKAEMETFKQKYLQELDKNVKNALRKNLDELKKENP